MPKLDLVFAISSTSTDADETFKLMTSTISSLVQKYDSSNIRYGLLVYGKDYAIVVDVKNNTDAENVNKQLATVAPLVGGSALDKVLKAAAEMFSQAGDRLDADRVLVIMTDKSSLLDEDVLFGATKSLVKMAVKIIPVAVGTEVSPTEFNIVTAKSNIITTNKDEDPDELGEEIMEKAISKYNMRIFLSRFN